MKNKILIEKRTVDKDPRERVTTRIFSNGEEIYKHKDYKNHYKQPKQPKFKHPNEHVKPPKPPKHHIFIDDYTMKTKMFTSKDDLVNFVNEIGEEGNKIDIFKIEDGLYKVVIFEKNELEVEDIIKQHEIEIEEIDINEDAIEED